MSWTAFAKWRHGSTIWANYHLNLPERFRFVKRDDILALGEDGYADDRPNILLLDEVGLYFNARRSGSDANIDLQPVIFQSRKLNMDISWTAQLTRSPDVTLRENTDIVIECYDKPKRSPWAHGMMKDRVRRIDRPFRIDLRPIIAANLYDTLEVVGMPKTAKKSKPKRRKDG